MRILLLTHSFNSLAQRMFVELGAHGHEVTVELDINDAVTIDAVRLAEPDLVIAPFLKRAIPEAVWRRVVCLVVHPGPRGDRGPSALDWAILEGEKEWGVTVLQAEAEMDAGPVWAWRTFQMRDAAKSSLYRNEVTQAAVAAVLEAVERVASRSFLPERLAVGAERVAARQPDRAIDWGRDTAATVSRKIRSADGSPGLKDELFGRTVYLHDAHAAPGLSGAPGAVVARSGPAIARATADGAVWIGHVRDPAGPHPFKLPVTSVLAGNLVGVPEIEVDSPRGYCEIRYEEDGPVGALYFDFYNGAMGTEACRRLHAAYRAALERPTKVIVLMGGAEFWSNGMNLNLIEAAPSPADESWRNINALDDLSEAIIRTESHLTIAALRGNAGAGGVFLARAADRVWLRDGIVLNPHYKDMGNLYGSELWSYLLPKRAGHEAASRIVQARLPMGADEAVSLGLADACLGACRTQFPAHVAERAQALAVGPTWRALINEKKRGRAADEAEKPLSRYRAEELERMRLNFYGFDPSYHVARSNFVRKVVKSRTPVTIARHRDRRLQLIGRKAS